MKNSKLFELNFSSVLGYDHTELRERGPKNRYDPPLTCTSVCTECDSANFARSSETQPALMSHACHTSDYENTFGSLSTHLQNINAVSCDKPVVFLLEDPGGDWDNGVSGDYDGFVKKPPTKHYYWMPHLLSGWPTDKWIKPSKRGEIFGDYFAYLMVRHGLTNVYITNLRKCKWPEPVDIRACTTTCTKTFLSKEIEIFNPLSVLCFGRGPYEEFRKRFPHHQSIYVAHPTAIHLAARHRKTPEEMVMENDKRIESMLSC